MKDTLHEDRPTFVETPRRIFVKIRNISETYFRGNETVNVIMCR